MTPAEEVKSRLDIVDVIREYVDLKAAGVNLKARCPFHDEKTPSFMVSKTRQSWHCFGCNEGGDMFTFIMKQEGLQFPDALRLLAGKAGVTVKAESPQHRTERERLGATLAAAVKFWETTLWESPGAKDARQYLQDERMVLPEAVREWHLGFAPDSWDALVNALGANGFTEEEMVKAGVAARKMARGGRSVYDRFRNRIIFPLTNAHGQVVGATGRVMPGSDDPAKYVNTPETSLYKKGEVLYGFHAAKDAIRKENLAVLVEGNVDVITSHQAEVKNVVAASGTALTTMQVGLVKRFCSRVAFAFDADAAGTKATLRGVLPALGHGLDVLAITLPPRANGEQYKDPDELIRERPEAWQEAVRAAEPLIEVELKRYTGGGKALTLDEKRAATATLVPLIAAIPDEVAKAHYLQALAAAVQVSEGYLREQMRKEKPTVVASAQPTEAPPAAPTPSSHQLLSEQLLAAALVNLSSFPTLLAEIKAEHLHPTTHDLYEAMTLYYTKDISSTVANWSPESLTVALAKSPHADQLLRQLNALSLLGEREFAALSTGDFLREVERLIRRLKRGIVRVTLERLRRDIAAAEADPSTSPDTLRTLLGELQHASEQLSKLND